MRKVGELRLVVRLEQEADDFADEFVRPRRQPEWSAFPVPFGNVGSPGRLEAVALVAHRINDASDLDLRHAVHGFPIDPGCHGPLVGVHAPVGQ